MTMGLWMYFWDDSDWGAPPAPPEIRILVREVAPMMLVTVRKHEIPAMSGVDIPSPVTVAVDEDLLTISSPDVIAQRAAPYTPGPGTGSGGRGDGGHKRHRRGPRSKRKHPLDLARDKKRDADDLMKEIKKRT